MDDIERLEMVAEAVRYCQRVRDMGMPVGGYDPTPREAILVVWTLRFGPKAKAAKYRSRAAVGLKWGRWEICFEHAIPYRYELEALLALAEVTPETVRPVLDKFDVHAIITKAEHDQLSAAGLNSKMPDGWDGADALARYNAVGIELVENAGWAGGTKLVQEAHSPCGTKVVSALVSSVGD